MQTRELAALPRVSKSIDDIRAALFGFVDNVQDALTAKGWLPARLNLNKGVLRGILEITAWGLWQLYNLLQRLMRQAAPYYATGEWLDLHADGVDLTRRAATKATGRVRFLRGSGVGNIVIPAGRIVRTLPDGTGEVYRYSTTAQGVLPSGAEHVEIPVESESYGAGANVTVAQICELATPIAGVSGVTNAADWMDAEGANEETDTQLQERYWLQWAGNNGVTKHAYKAWALNVPGVTSVSILDQHPRGQGTVDIVVRGAAVLPTDSLLDKVRASIAPKVPINDDWLVKSPVAIPVAITGEITITAGDLNGIAVTVETRLRALFAETSTVSGVTALQIGQDVTLDLLTYTVMAVPGVKRVAWASPLSDVSIAADAVARLESLAITCAQADEA